MGGNTMYNIFAALIVFCVFGLTGCGDKDADTGDTAVDSAEE